MYLSIGQASIMLGVSISTLRRWELSCKLRPSYRTSGGHRRYEFNLLKKFLGVFNSRNDKRKTIAYASVSSHDQKDDLSRQRHRLKKYCKLASKNYEIIDDLGSGLNYKKRGLRKLMKLLLSGQVSRLVLTHKDRLLRFGSEIVFIICDFFNTRIEVIEEAQNLSDEQVLAFDVLEIIT